MKIIIPGGTGQVGTVLARALHGAGQEVVVLSRSPQAGPEAQRRSGCSAPWRTAPWDPGDPRGAWAAELEGADAVINLAGRSVNCRYHARNRREIMDSRVISTRAVGQAIAQAKRPPPLWLQASTATIYAHRYDAPNDEATGILGGGEPDAPSAWRFSIDVATAWERTLDEAVTPRTRKVKMRSAMVMSPDRGGIFDTLLQLVRLGLGGPAGDGRQYVSWVHHADFVRAVQWLIEHDEMEGAVNIAAPNPLPYAEFMRALRQAWGIRVGLPAAGWMIEVGTFLLRTESELVLKSRRVVPERLIQAGFEFRFPHWPEAAMDLCKSWREMHRGRGNMTRPAEAGAAKVERDKMA